MEQAKRVADALASVDSKQVLAVSRVFGEEEQTTAQDTHSAFQKFQHTASNQLDDIKKSGALFGTFVACVAEEDEEAGGAMQSNAKVCRDSLRESIPWRTPDLLDGCASTHHRISSSGPCIR